MAVFRVLEVVCGREQNPAPSFFAICIHLSPHLRRWGDRNGL